MVSLKKILPKNILFMAKLKIQNTTKMVQLQINHIEEYSMFEETNWFEEISSL